MKEVIQAQLNDKHSNLWGLYFKIPESVAKKFSNGKDKRIIAKFNNQIEHHCAIMFSQEGPFIMINKSLVKKIKIEIGERVEIEITKDTSEYGMPISEEFEAVILGDDAVFPFFDQLTPGKKRNLIHLVNKIKSPDIKINRSMAIAAHLAESKGKIDFKQLNEKIKEFNQRNRIS